jgi:N-acetylmuramoyl-L-alanine amidase
MALRTTTKYIVIHCAATRAGMDAGAKEIDQWHRARGWSGIGYHFVIRRDGKVEKGRPENAIGSHVAGHNSNTLGVCLVGGLGEGKGWPPENNFTPAQWTALKALLTQLRAKYPLATILGHRDFPGVSKACPSFDARAWATANGFPAAPTLRGKAVQASAIGFTSGMGADGAHEAAEAVETNADQLSALLGTGRETFTEVSQYLAWGGKVLAVIAILTFLYAAYRGLRMAWRWYRGENDYGAAEPEDAALPEAPAEDPAPTRRRKRRASDYRSEGAR